jgi:hypothetical protein
MELKGRGEVITLYFYCRGEPFIYLREWLTNIKGVTKGLRHNKIYSVKCGMCEM